MAARLYCLPELLKACGARVEGPVPAIPIPQVTDDSRAVREGALFVAVQGAAADGHRYVSRAVENGAKAVLAEQDVPVPAGIVKLRVPSTRALLGPLAHAFYGSPSQQLRMIGVTGTQGKTTVTWMIHHLLQSAGMPCGLLGTVCNKLGQEERPSAQTTPGAVVLQGHLAQMLDRGLQACVMEVSSHALDQLRTDGIRWACGLFTNLAPEHLDYHRSLDRYLQAKLRLFKNLPRQASAVVHLEAPAVEMIRRATQARMLTYGLQEGADLTAEEIQCTLEGTTFRLRTPAGRFHLTTRLIGHHNVENWLAAVGAVLALDVRLEEALQGVQTFPGVPGRLERMDCGQPFPVFVDYAHTEESLRRVLEELKRVFRRRILTVFGCGGDRDRSKRPRMGRVAAQMSGRVIVTSDNPRSEDPSAIASEIVAGMAGVQTPCEVILDRREAIRAALESSGEDDLVLIAGKGHETQQVFSERVIPFDDRMAVREILNEGERVLG